jgi:hypothetical protein
MVFCRPFPDKTQACGRCGPIAHDVAQAEYFIDLLPIDVGKHGFQSIDVAVDVGDEGDSGHGKTRSSRVRELQWG